MKGLSRGNSLLFRKKEKEIPEKDKDKEKRSITINLTLNLSLDKESFDKAMDALDVYSDLADDSSSYKKSEKDYRDYRYRQQY